jgi:hypothetical protein
VLGIEDLGSAPRQGTAGASGNGGDEAGGSSGADASTSSGGRITGTGARPGSGGAATGGGNNGGAGGLVPDASVGGAGGAGGATSGGAGGRAAGGAGGQNTGGGGGAGGATGGPVNGKVIDFWGHPVPNAIVTVGTAPSTDTGTTGTFSVAGVSGTYDVSLVVSYAGTTEGWLYKGLTRRDPTLQVDTAFDYHNADTYATTVGFMFPGLGTQTVGYAFGSADGNFSGVIAESPENLYYVYYYGPATTTGGAHALRWQYGAQNLPTIYKAYDTIQLTMVQAPTPVNFNLALGDDASLMTGTISGNVTTGASTRENHVYVRFDDGAALEVVNDPAPAAAGDYSYKVPVGLQNSGITVAAVDGVLGYPPIAIVHQDGAAAGQTVNLTIPSGRALLAPVDSATTTATTDFRWTTGASVSVFTIAIDPFNGYNKMHVVTAGTSVKIPSFPDATYTIPQSVECYWWVETHGNWATMDDAAGSTGFMSAFTHHALEGPRTGGGSYTETIHRRFTSPP